ncbi:DUF2997 domain-containing protein [Bacillus marasmi]|uniref:DUF2997 domain-containing protein n=1 Tax=Bacillus marasmi TaxID=1926279 RepID=UPI0011CBE70B|nr:DUF2997 domain-containing protein [Bacillus marasmi]
MKKVKIEITPDGKIFAETLGIKGKDCTKMIEILEKLLDAETTDSAYTEEYHQVEKQYERTRNQQVLKGEG